MQNETTRHKGKQEERQAGRQDRRQDLGKADTPSNTKADTLRKPTPNSTLFEKNAKSDHPPQRETRRKTSWETSWETRRKTSWETKETKEGGHTIQHRETRRETMGDKGETRPRESGRTMQHRSHISREIMGGNENQDSGRWTHHPTQAHMWGQWETIGGNGRQWETRGDNRRQG